MCQYQECECECECEYNRMRCHHPPTLYWAYFKIHLTWALNYSFRSEFQLLPRNAPRIKRNNGQSNFYFHTLTFHCYFLFLNICLFVSNFCKDFFAIRGLCAVRRWHQHENTPREFMHSKAAFWNLRFLSLVRLFHSLFLSARTFQMSITAKTTIRSKWKKFWFNSTMQI